MFDSLCDWIIEKDLVLIMRVPYSVDTSSTEPQSGHSCARFWALIPPVAGAIDTSVDPLMSRTLNTKYKEEYKRSAFILVMLVERDDVYVPNRSVSERVTKQEDEDAESDSVEASLAQDVRSYLDSALTEACGVPEDYKPWVYTGGQLDVQFSRACSRGLPPSYSTYHSVEPIVMNEKENLPTKTNFRKTTTTRSKVS